MNKPMKKTGVWGSNKFYNQGWNDCMNEWCEYVDTSTDMCNDLNNAYVLERLQEIKWEYFGLASYEEAKKIGNIWCFSVYRYTYEELILCALEQGWLHE